MIIRTVEDMLAVPPAEVPAMLAQLRAHLRTMHEWDAASFPSQWDRTCFKYTKEEGHD